VKALEDRILQFNMYEKQNFIIHDK